MANKTTQSVFVPTYLSEAVQKVTANNLEAHRPLLEELPQSETSPKTVLFEKVSRFLSAWKYRFITAWDVLRGEHHCDR